VSAATPLTIDEAIWTRVVDGVNTVPGTLAAQFTTQPTLFFFLRHFG
jgi:hypothetical protein